MNKKKKIILIVAIAFMFIIGLICMIISIKSRGKVEIPVKTIEVLDNISGYNYSLEDRDTSLYKEKFLELKTILTSDSIDDKEYATTLAELFAIDLYTIDNKNSKYDVGSLDFIYPEEQEKFKNKVMDTMYKLVEDNSTNTRRQELPIVSKTEVTNVKKINYTKGETKLNGYEVYLDISYEKDLGYDTKLIITIIREEEKMYVVSLTTDEE